jgi:hypothetical protein
LSRSIRSNLFYEPHPLYPLPLNKGKGKFILRGASAPLRLPFEIGICETKELKANTYIVKVKCYKYPVVITGAKNYGTSQALCSRKIPYLILIG